MAALWCRGRCGVTEPEGGDGRDRQAAGGEQSSGPGEEVPLGRHRRHCFPARAHVVKVRYDDGELSAVRRAAAAAGLRPGGYVASAALAMARQLLDPAVSVTGGPPGHGAVVASAALTPHQDRELLAELVQARLALRRYGVNVNQAAAVLNSGGAAPVWLEQAVAGGDRAVARVDTAAAALARRLR